MTHRVADRVQDKTTSTGTGTITLANAPPRTYITVASIPSITIGDTFDYAIFHLALNEFEVGRGTWAGSLSARADLPAAIAELFEAQRAFSGNDERFEALRQVWLERLAPYIAANGGGAGGAANGNVDAGLVAQLQTQVDTLVQQVNTLVGTLQDQSREISRLLATR